MIKQIRMKGESSATGVIRHPSGSESVNNVIFINTVFIISIVTIV